jgi:hypothetical protein
MSPDEKPRFSHASSAAAIAFEAADACEPARDDAPTECSELAAAAADFGELPLPLLRALTMTPIIMMTAQNRRKAFALRERLRRARRRGGTRGTPLPRGGACSGDVTPELTIRLGAGALSSIHNCHPWGGAGHSGEGRQSGGGTQPGGGAGQFGGGLNRYPIPISQPATGVPDSSPPSG